MHRLLPIASLIILLSSCAATVADKSGAPAGGIQPGDLIQVSFKYYPDFDQVFFVTVIMQV